jgi:lysophospholipase L1-like esterase
VATGGRKMRMLRPYAAILQQILDEGFGRGRVEVINLGMIGYSSYHGLRVLRREGLGLDPDFVVIRFGWNDFVASPAGRSFANVHAPWLEKLEDLAYRSRLFALLTYRGVPMERRNLRAGRPSAHPVPWVTEKEYAWNLSRMIDLSREHGAEPILLDAPAAPITREIRENEAFIEGTGYQSLDRYLAAHDRYQSIAEQIARAKGVRFLRTAPPPTEAGRYFTVYDIAHPNEEGQARIAYRLNAELAPTLAGKFKR